MSDPVELYCTLDEDTGKWLVWFPRTLGGGMYILETFDYEADARQFWQDQIDSSDFGDRE